MRAPTPLFAGRRLRHAFRRVLRGVMLAGTLAGYLAVALGFPVARPVAKDRSQLFPCMDRPCGCLSAEQCFDHCCCFTDEQKVAWAEAHRVQLPERVVRRVQARRATPASRTAGRQNGSCCARRPAAAPPACGHDACPVPEGEARVADCCRREATPAGQPPGENRRPGRLGWVLGSEVLGCQGMSVLWLSWGAVLPPDQWNLSRPDPPLADWLVPQSHSPRRVFQAVATPPPRV